MQKIEFTYFRDPQNFAFRTDEAKPCSACGEKGIWLDGSGFYGARDIDCICYTCLSEGKLKELEIETNETFEGSDEQKEIIVFRTPALPTWQDRYWPFRDGDYCIFEKIASKLDFIDKAEFINSFSTEDQEDSDLNDVWERYLPEKPIASIQDGNYDISVYLFTRNGKKHCTWDAS
ncbi:MAG TPA: hypothetical protein DD473_11405 [Planctomycetaceae bacterium]|nr:hypothetical protein [Planctomycetaceae bacterium]